MRWLFSKSGFSLVELALLLVVVSFIAITTLVSKQEKQSITKRYNTTKELEDLKEALETYKGAFGYYPCPANPGVAVGGSGFGLGVGSGGGSCTAANIRSNGAGIVMGMIPVRSLSVSFENAFDRWGNRVAYAVSEAATADPGTAADIKVIHNWDELDSNPENPGAVTMASVPYVILSYGEDGVGAYTKDGSAQIQPVSLGSSIKDSDLQNENHHLRGGSFNGVFIRPQGRFTQEKVEGQPPSATQVALTFDDVVTYAAGVTTEPDLTVICEGVCVEPAPDGVTCQVANEEGCCVAGKVWSLPDNPAGECECLMGYGDVGGTCVPNAPNTICESEGGVWNPSPQNVCYFSGGSCPTGWSKGSNWSSTSARTCRGNWCGSRPCNGSTQCTTGSHTRANAASETCTYYRPERVRCPRHVWCDYSPPRTCTASTTEVGCTKN